MSIYVVAAVVNYVINVCFCNNEDPVSYYIIIKKNLDTYVLANKK